MNFGLSCASRLLLAVALLMVSLSPALADDTEAGDHQPSSAASEYTASADTTSSATILEADNAQLLMEPTVQVKTSSDETTSSWSLPISGPLEFVKKQVRRTVAFTRGTTAQEASKELSGSISFSDPYEGITTRLDELLETALYRDTKSIELDKAVNHYRKKTQVVIAEGKEATNYLIPYRGFGPSKEAGDIILDEKVKLKSRAAAEYAKQKQIDDTHLKVASSMMQIAMGLGMEDKGRGAEITGKGLTSLKELVGDEQAEKTLALLNSMGANIDLNDPAFSKQAWDIEEKQSKQKQILELALEDDMVVHQIKKHIHKYNHKSKFTMVSSQVVQVVLGSASLTPSFVGPAAKTALMAYIMATGGPEQSKLLKQLYLDKRLESRWKVLNEEAHMALDNYQLALLTKNPILLACSESLVGQMVGGHHIDGIFGRSHLATKERKEVL